MRDNIITYIHTYSRLPEAGLRVGLFGSGLFE